MKSLFELRRLILSFKDFLPRVTVPTLIIQADKDPIVASSSAEELFGMLGSNNKTIKMIHAEHHGILKDNTENTWGVIDTFMDESWELQIKKLP